MKFEVYGYIKDVVPCVWMVEAKDKDEAMEKVKDSVDGEHEDDIVEDRRDWDGYIQYIAEDAREAKEVRS